MTDVSTLKTRADHREVQTFMERSLGMRVQSLQAIDGGEGALAFDVSTDSGSCIFRLGSNEKHFDKDRIAHNNFNGADIPIPAILRTGQFNERLFFAISEKAVGVRLDLLNQESTKLLRPMLMQTLSNIHAIVAPEGTGFGRWHAEFVSTAKTWTEHVSNSAKSHLPTGRNINEVSQIHDWRDRANELISKLPNLRQLAHGDFGFNNAFAKDNRVSAVIDWAESFYGDPLYDVAWLTFWSQDQDNSFLGDYQRTQSGQKFAVESVAERMECYQLRIKLGALDHFERSNQWKAYESVFRMP